MRRKRQFKARLLSLFLALMLILGNVSGVQAQEMLSENVQTENVQEEQSGTQKDAQSGTQENAQSENEGAEKGDIENHESSEKGLESGEAESEILESGSMEDEGSAEGKKSVGEENVNVETDPASVETEESAGVAETSKTGVGITASLRVDGYGKSVLYPTNVKLPDTYRTLKSYGLGHVKDPGYYTPLHMLAEYCEQNGMNPEEQIEVTEEGNVNNFLGAKTSEDAFMMFAVNNDFPADPSTGRGYLQGTYPLQAGDQVVLYSWHHYNSVYAYFTEENVNVSAGQAFTVTLKSNDGMGSGAVSCEGADILVQDTKGNTLESGDYSVSGKTDSKGQAAITINKAGTYLLTAEKKTDGTQHDLNRPYAKVIVSEPAAMSDEEAVQSDKAALAIENAEQVKENLVLPEEGKNGTTITWESSDENIVKKDGTVKRPVGADKKVILTAALSKGNVSDTKEIVVTVVGKALFKELKADHGTLVYDKNIDTYTLYVKDEVDKLTISGIAGEEESDVAFLKAKIYEASGEEKEKMVFPENNEGAFAVETWLKSESGEELTPQNVTLKTMGNVQGTVTIHVKRGNPGAPLPDLPDITWGQHLGDKNNNAVVNSKAPTDKAELLWESFSNAPDIWGSVYAGTPILVNNHIYAVRDHKIESLDAKTGEVKNTAPLYSQVGYYSNIIYGGGMIFVPLGNGDIQVFHAETLKSMYIIKSPAAFGTEWNVYGAMHYDDGKLYVGYTNQGDYGGYAAYDTIDPNVDDTYEEVEPLWLTGQEDQSYYGSGAVTVGDKIIIAGDSGIVSVRNKATGEELSKCQLSGKVRSALVYADGYIWTAAQGKKIYKLALSENGNIQIVEEADLPEITSSSPVVAGGKVFITGGTFGAGGFLAVYDKNLKLLAQEKGANPFNTPTVTTAYEDSYVYFTENGPEGHLYMAKVSADNQIKLVKLYTPEHPQYSMSKVVIGDDGTLYYANDAGYLFAIRGGSDEEPEKPDGGTDPDDGKDDGEDGKDDGKDDESQNGGNHSSTGMVPSQKPGEKLTVAEGTKNFAPRKRTIKVDAATKGDASSESNIIKAIQQSYEKKETSLAIKNPPEVIGSEVFEKLAEYPEFRLIFDCGSYTLSIKGSDVTNINAKLATKLLELENTLSGEEAEKYGIYQQLMFAQEGPLPGKITIVYKLGEKFEQSEALYLYDLSGNTEAKEVLLQKPYGMFTLENGGEFILSDQEIEEAERTDVMEISEEIKPVEEKITGVPFWICLLIGLGAGGILGCVITVSVLRARKRKETWEE